MSPASVSAQPSAVPPASNNPWATLDPIATTSTSQNGNNNIFGATSSNSDFPGPLMMPSGSSGFNTNSALVPIPTAVGTNDNAPARKRTPADFLGDHKDLVDLEKLVDRNPGKCNSY